MGGNDWQIVEHDSFELAVAQCGGAEQVDAVIAPILYGLSRHPEGFPETSVAGVRLARTKLQFNGPDIVLAHSVWFRLNARERTVELLWIQISPPEDLI